MSLNRRTVNRQPNNSSFAMLDNGSGSVLDLTQEVELLESGSGALVTISQEVINTGSGALLTFNQMVIDSTVTTFLTRNGWYPILVIGGARIPDNQIEALEIIRTENDSAAVNFGLIPPTGTIDLTQYEGQEVTLDIILYPSGDGYRVYTGTVNIPEIDLINKKLAFTCNDNRAENIDTQLSAILPYIGWYSEEAFGVPGDSADILEKRLSTVPKCVDFNAYGSPVISDLLAKAVPDITLYDADVYRDDGHDPVVRLSPRSRLVNTINLTATYQFQRLHHRNIVYSWEAPYADDACEFLTHSYSVASRDMVRQAVASAGWVLNSEITFRDVLAAGWYRCSGGTIGWGTAQLTATNVDSGTKDATGNTVYTAVPTNYQDLGAALCFGADWTASKRWSQNITEKYTLSVTAPQSIAQYGEIAQESSIGVASEYDSSGWEKYDTYTPPTALITDQDTNLMGWYNNTALAIARAQTTIIKSHRDNRVIFQCELHPEFDLSQTIYLNCTRLQAQGKVRSIRHKLNVTTGEAVTICELALSRSTGSSSTTSPMIVPTRPTYTPASGVTSITLDSHYGDAYSRFGVNDVDPAWTGHIGNKSFLDANGNGARSNWTHAFIVDTPPIEDAARSNVELAGTGTYTTEIQNDLLEIIF